MNYNDTLDYIHSIPKFRRPLGNANLEKLLNILGNPQKQLKFIHIAGTNGKGSTAAMTAEILKQSGYKTGLFTSPFIEVFNERMKINGENISDSDLISCVEQVKTAMEENDALVSEFAFVTAVAFLYFFKQNCDIIVLEVGMGGKLDATNVIDASLVSVICKIGLDHTQYLGETIEKITAEKCGIIRKNGVVVSYPNDDVKNIIENYAQEKNAVLIFADKADITEKGFIYKGKEYPLALKGTYQPQNAAVVIEIIEALKKQGFKISEKAVIEGLKNTQWPARFELVSENVVIDGGHNLDGIQALKKSLLSLNKDIVLVMAMMEDKDYESCIKELIPIADTVIGTELNMPRCLKAEKIAEIAESMNITAFVNTNPQDALKQALAICDKKIVCVCGSLYLAGEIRKIFNKNKKLKVVK